MNATPPSERHGLGLASGVGLVAANMIGAGVLLSTGFLAQHMDPGVILCAWVAGAALALCGALAYSEIAANDGRSGGEYAYLARSWHPVIGSMAGMASLVFGFAAPLAVDAYAVGDAIDTASQLAAIERLLLAAEPPQQPTNAAHPAPPSATGSYLA